MRNRDEAADKTHPIIIIHLTQAADGYSSLTPGHPSLAV